MLKKTYALLLSIMLILTLTACAKDEEKTDIKDTSNQPKFTVTETASGNNSSDESDSSQTETVSSEKDESSPAESKPKTEPAKTESETKTTVIDNSSKQTVSEEKPKKQNTESKEYVQKTDTTEKEKITVKDEPDVVEPVVRAEPREVETLIAKYINELRINQGDTTATVLTGLTNVARYRANELITDFSHTDIRESCGKLKYGTYYDMTQYGMDAKYNYYEGYDREAIAKGNWGGTADEIARNIANGFKNSTKHWDYVGDSKYGYMAVGATYDEGTNMWYICVCMSSTNYGG